MTAPRDPLRAYIQRTAIESLRNGFGDPDAPLAPGEYVHEAKSCPHIGCDWLLPIEWRHERRADATRFRGLIATDRLCQAHLEEHVAQNWAAS